MAAAMLAAEQNPLTPMTLDWHYQDEYRQKSVACQSVEFSLFPYRPLSAVWLGQLQDLEARERIFLGNRPSA